MHPLENNVGSNSVSLVHHDGRILSIDVFRALTILTMIFVNDLGWVKNIPGWMRHMPPEQDGMTFVDVVFPAFLFIVGMAIPFALKRRKQKSQSTFQIWIHIIIRTAGLLIIGIFMVNMYIYNREATALNRDLWIFLMYLGVILVWNSYPKVPGIGTWLYPALRITGCALLITMAAMYRGGSGAEGIWMRTSWWGILGLIGWAYLTSCAGYLLFQKQIAGIMGFLSLLVLLYIGDKVGALNFLGVVKEYIWIGGQIGGHSSIAVAGVIVGMLYLEGSPAPTPPRRIVWILSFGIGLAIAGYLLRPLYGISKNLATPAWCLYCSAICCFLYVFLYWLIDVKHITGWTKPIQPAGANPLLAYILPDIVFALLSLLGIDFLKRHLNEGLIGICRSVIFAFLIVGLTGLLYKLHIRLRL